MSGGYGGAVITDLTDDEARRAMVLKWGSVDADVLPAWVAEMDYAPAPEITAAVHEAVAAGQFGYPDFGDAAGLGSAYSGFAQRHYGQIVDPADVRPVVDVTAGVRVLLDLLSGPGAVVMPLPGYPPQLDVAAVTGRRRVDLELDPDAERAEIDLDRLDRLFADGAETLLLTQPHNPWGRVFTRTELEGIRDVVLRHGARVISDEIHAPLVLPGAEHVSYLSLEGTADHVAAVVAASKAFNTPGLRCAQIVTADERTRARLDAAPMARNDSWSPLGVVAAVAAYEHGDAWLASLIDRLRRAAATARRTARRAPADGADAAARGHLPGLARPPSLRERESGGGSAGARPCAALRRRRVPTRAPRPRAAQHRHVAGAPPRNRAAAGPGPDRLTA